MKLLLLGIIAFGVLSIASFSATAQAQTPFERWACLSRTKCQRSDDPSSKVQEFARTAKIGRLWPEERANITSTFQADHISSDQNVFRLKGHAEITTTTVTLTADEADYHWETGEIDARGNVHVKPIPYNPNSGVRQFGVR